MGRVHAAQGSRVGEPRQVDVPGLVDEVAPVVLGEVVEPSSRARRQGDEPRALGDDGLLDGAPLRLGDDDVGVGATEAEGAHPGEAGAGLGGPRFAGCLYSDPQTREGNARVGRVEVDAGHQLAVVKREGHLDEAGEAGGGFEVAEVALDGADATRLVRRAAVTRDVAQGFELDRVAEGRAASMGLDVLHLAGLDSRVSVGVVEHRPLRAAVGGHQAIGAAIAVDGAAEDRRPDVLAVGEGFRQGLEHDGDRSLGADDAVGPGVEGLAHPVAGQHSGLRKDEVELRRENGVDAADDGQVALASPQALDGQVRGDEGGGAGRVDRHGGAVQIELVGDSVGGEGERPSGAVVGVGPVGGSKEAAGVIEGADAHEDAGSTPGVGGGEEARALERLGGDLEEPALLWIHASCFASGDIEGPAVERLDILQEAAPERPRHSRVCLGELEGAPSVGWNLARCVSALAEELPELERRISPGQSAADADDGDGLVGCHRRPGQGEGAWGATLEVLEELIDGGVIEEERRRQARAELLLEIPDEGHRLLRVEAHGREGTVIVQLRWTQTQSAGQGALSQAPSLGRLRRRHRALPRGAALPSTP